MTPSQTTATPPPATVPADDAVRKTTRDTILLRVVAIATVVPFYWAAFRDARNGFYPTLDIAATVLRARDVFSSQPPLVGMWSSGSTWAGHEIHFPGAIQLYLMAVPIRVLGNVWGPLLTMATLNAFWVLLAGWLVRRRFGVHAAMIAFACLAAFMWSIGSENLIDVRPMQMVTIPFLCFLFAVWVVADGDVGALPALAVVANFLFLDHLVQVLQIPVIGLCAVAGVVIWFRRERRGPPDRREDAGRRLRRGALQAGAITLVMWLPSLIEQFTNPPGNLRQLFAATGEHRDPVGSIVVGYNTVIRPIATPSFWFRGRFDQDAFPQGLETLGVTDALAGLAVVAVLGTLLVVAIRRRDHAVSAVVGVVGVAILVSIETVRQSAAVWGFLPYVRSVWALAAFVWFAVIFGVWRLFAGRIRAAVARTGAAAALVLCVMALSYANFGSAINMKESESAKAMVDATVPLLTGHGSVLVVSSPDFTSETYYASLLVALDTAGVHYCVVGIAVAQYGPLHDCAGEAEVGVLVDAGTGAVEDREGMELLSETSQLTAADQRRLDRATRITREWLASHDEIRLSALGRTLLDDWVPETGSSWDNTFAPADGDLGDILDSDMFVLFLEAQSSHLRTPGSESIFDEPDLPVDAMLTVSRLTSRGGPIRVWKFPISAWPDVIGAP